MLTLEAAPGPDVTLVIDASVGLKWVLAEPDSHRARALAVSDERLLVPDVWMHEACNVVSVQGRKNVHTPAEAREGLALSRARIEPTPTAPLGLHDVALEIGLAVGHSIYDTLYVAFAMAMGAKAVVVADRPFVRSMRAQPDPIISGLLPPLSESAATGGLA